MMPNGLNFAFALAVTGILLTACGGSGSSESETSYEFPVVGTLSSNQYEVLLHTAPEGPRYSLMEHDLKQGSSLLAQEMTASEFEERFPLVHDQVRGLWAGSDLPATFSKEIPLERSTEIEWKQFEVDTSDIELPPLPDLRNED